MPFAACPSCNQQNFSRAEDARTLRCVRCGQVFWVKAAASPSRRSAQVDAARAAASALRHDGPAAAA